MKRNIVVSDRLAGKKLVFDRWSVAEGSHVRPGISLGILGITEGDWIHQEIDVSSWTAGVIHLVTMPGQEVNPGDVLAIVTSED